jgi:hypothetical protein
MSIRFPGTSAVSRPVRASAGSNAAFAKLLGMRAGKTEESGICSLRPKDRGVPFRSQDILFGVPHRRARQLRRQAWSAPSSYLKVVLSRAYPIRTA